jgi:hypothetical protein
MLNLNLILNVNNFGPFSSEVWGTVSDWVLIIVTFFTALFIYRTLKAQVKVSSDQHQLLNIEQRKYRKMFEPEFSVQGGSHLIGDGRKFYLNLSLEKNNAYNIIIEIDRAPYFPDRKFENKKDELKIGGTFSIINLVPLQLEEPHDAQLNISVRYCDINGEPYRQIITGYLLHPHISAPKYLID